jgi:hypothetical protein
MPAIRSRDRTHTHVQKFPEIGISRAEEHLIDLRERLARLGWEYANSFIPEFDPNPPHQIRLTFSEPLEVPVPMSIGVRIGEICYNLRSALDYFIFELARLDSSTAQSGTQFPIEDRRNRFKKRETTWLKCVNASHIAFIKGLQPFNGCDWTRSLRDFSNRDKHRESVGITGRFFANAYTPAIHREYSRIDAPIFRTKHPTLGEVDVKVNVTIFVQFADGAPIVETLEKIKAGVTETLEAFKAEF